MQLITFLLTVIRSHSPKDKSSKNSFDVATQRPAASFSSFNNPEFIMYDGSKTAQSQNDENNGMSGDPSRPTEGAVEPLANQADVPYSY
ncbi:hypothetical protein LSAT2_015795 [Lamellibrachia satsuma]|nr:hypothetical protein LSAT2_015795 [Lamellibrachia satsuma]